MKRKLGFYYINDSNWTGGQDYIVNLINVLRFLPLNEQPSVEVIVDDSIDLMLLKRRIEYEKFSFYVLRDRKWLFPRITNFLNQRLRWKFVYPFPKGGYYESLLFGVKKKRRLYWIPDFQEEYFPDFFSTEIINKRRRIRRWLAMQNDSIVFFSSVNAQNDFYKFYGPNITAKTKTLQFVNPDKWEFNNNEITDILVKNNLVRRKYFMCPNQFWKHKNHKVVIDSVREIIENNEDIIIVFCGKESDPRDPDYFPHLKMSCQDLIENGSLMFLGFLPKREQMCLLSQCLAVIQPSLFEGWSTTIEDAISFGKQVIASDLPVNREQLGELGLFFDPKSKESLINLLRSRIEDTEIDYNQRIRVTRLAYKIVRLNIQNE